MDLVSGYDPVTVETADGIPYPATVQHYWQVYVAPITDPLDWPEAAAALVDALEAAAAVRAEHPTPATDPDAAPVDELRDKLTGVFMSGFSSGVSTLLLNGGAPAGHMPMPEPMPQQSLEAIRHYADTFTARLFYDPAVRERTIDDVMALFESGTESPLITMTSYSPAHPDHPHPKGSDS